MLLNIIIGKLRLKKMLLKRARFDSKYQVFRIRKKVKKYEFLLSIKGYCLLISNKISLNFHLNKH
jgi:hypothetical protein